MSSRVLLFSIVAATTAVACSKKEPAPEAKPVEPAKAAAPSAPGGGPVATTPAAPAPAPAPTTPPAPTTTPPAPTPAVALPGPCVDPVKDVGTRPMEPSSSELPREAVPGPDLDGDGTPDRFVSLGTNVTTNTYAYVMRGSCGHFVGDIGRMPEAWADAPRTKGLVELRMIENGQCEGNPCGCIVGESRFKFDGTQYVFDQKASTPSRSKPCK